jgi:hypothetical protein
VTEGLDARDAAGRERVAALRAGTLCWLDASLRETTRDDLVAALDPPRHVLPALPATTDARVSRTLQCPVRWLGSHANASEPVYPPGRRELTCRG